MSIEKCLCLLVIHLSGWMKRMFDVTRVVDVVDYIRSTGPSPGLSSKSTNVDKFNIIRATTT